jgi:hypothetical protein
MDGGHGCPLALNESAVQSAEASGKSRVPEEGSYESRLQNALGAILGKGCRFTDQAARAAGKSLTRAPHYHHCA